MMTPNQILSDRVISAFPLSIGTSLALESIFDGRLPPFDPERPIPQKVDISKYNYHYFNIRTLIRNIMGSVSNLKSLFTESPAITETLLEEMEVIRDIYSVEGVGKCQPVFYITDYKILTTLESSGITIKKIKTDKQLMEHDLIERVVKDITQVPDNGILRFNHKINGKGKILITTHLATDLLSRRFFSDMSLLESHTGRLKTKREWYTKYHKTGKEPMFMLPFQERLLYIFGDKTQIVPMSITVRRSILKIASETNWNPLTTEDKVSFYLNKEPDLKKLYMGLPKIF